MKLINLIILLGIVCITSGCGGGGGGSDSDNKNPYASSYAGAYYASNQSNIYHYPACPSAKQIHSSNLVTFTTADIAVTSGYRPCLICTPPQGNFINPPPTLNISNISTTTLSVGQNNGKVKITYTLNISDSYRDINYIDWFVKGPDNITYDSHDITDFIGANDITMPTYSNINTNITGEHIIKVNVLDRANQSTTQQFTILVQ